MGERTVYLVRHGQLDLRAYAEDQRTAGLTEMGREQARLTAERLDALDVTAIHSSTITRARQTAEIISGQHPHIAVEESDLLREVPNLNSVHFDAELRNRAEQAFAKYIRTTRAKHEIDIVISHGNLIRYFAGRALGVAMESAATMDTSHCGVTQVHIATDGTIQVVCYNETMHLPGEVRS